MTGIIKELFQSEHCRCRSVGTILTGLMSFMYDDVLTTGAIRTSSAERRRLASQSLESNLRDPTFKKLFPEYIEEFEQRKKAQVWYGPDYTRAMPSSKHRHTKLLH